MGADPRALGDAGHARRARHRAAARHPGHPGHVPRRRASSPRRPPRWTRCSGGRAFVGLGAGWWEREHAAFGLPLPADRRAARPARARDRDHARAVAAGHQGVRRASASSCPRPPATRARSGTIPIIVGGCGERRTLRIAARLADGCNLPLGPRDVPTQAGRAAPALRGRRPRPGRGRGHRARPAGASARTATTLVPGRAAARAHRRRRRTPAGTTPAPPPTTSAATGCSPSRASAPSSSPLRTCAVRRICSAGPGCSTPSAEGLPLCGVRWLLRHGHQPPPHATRRVRPP